MNSSSEHSEWIMEEIGRIIASVEMTTDKDAVRAAFDSLPPLFDNWRDAKIAEIVAISRAVNGVIASLRRAELENDPTN